MCVHVYTRIYKLNVMCARVYMHASVSVFYERERVKQAVGERQ